MQWTPVWLKTLLTKSGFQLSRFLIRQKEAKQTTDLLVALHPVHVWHTQNQLCCAGSGGFSCCSCTKQALVSRCGVWDGAGSEPSSSPWQVGRHLAMEVGFWVVGAQCQEQCDMGPPVHMAHWGLKAPPVHLLPQMSRKLSYIGLLPQLSFYPLPDVCQKRR